MVKIFAENSLLRDEKKIPHLPRKSCSLERKFYHLHTDFFFIDSHLRHSHPKKRLPSFCRRAKRKSLDILGVTQQFLWFIVGKYIVCEFVWLECLLITEKCGKCFGSVGGWEITHVHTLHREIAKSLPPNACNVLDNSRHISTTSFSHETTSWWTFVICT